MKQLNQKEKNKACKLANKIGEFMDNWDNLSCELVTQKDFFLSQLSKDKALKVYELMGNIANELNRKGR